MTLPALPVALTTGVVRVRGLVADVIAQAPPPPADPSAGKGEEFGKTSPLALVVILLLALATIVLIRSMSKRLRNVPASFDEVPAPGVDAAGGRGPEARGETDATPHGGTISGAPPRADAPGDGATEDADDSASSSNPLRRTQRPPRAGSP